jgi:hypothetical protein
MSAGDLTRSMHYGRTAQSDSSAKAPPRETPLSPDLELLAHWTDSVFRIPGLGLRFGLDAILGLIPGLGDITTSLASLYILSAASRYNVPRITLARMALNILLDTLIGAIPLVGDLFDAFWKSNRRNVELLRRHVAAPPSAARRLERSDRWFVVAVIVGLVAAMIGAAFAAFWILSWIVTALGNAIG